MSTSSPCAVSWTTPIPVSSFKRCAGLGTVSRSTHDQLPAHPDPDPAFPLVHVADRAGPGDLFVCPLHRTQAPALRDPRPGFAQPGDIGFHLNHIRRWSSDPRCLLSRSAYRRSDVVGGPI